MAELALMDRDSWSGEEECLFRLDRSSNEAGIRDTGDKVALWSDRDPYQTLHMDVEQARVLAERILNIIDEIQEDGL